MRLTVVGCSGSYPGPESPASCYLLEAEGFRLVLDLGSGSLGALQRHAGLREVDAVCLSHLHADHCLDLCGYHVVRMCAPGGPLPRLPVYAPAGAAARLDAAYGMPEEPSVDRSFEFHALKPGSWAIGPFEVTAALVNHPVETYGFRVSHGGRAVAYSADTGSAGVVAELARAADLLLCEASFLDRPGNRADLHLNGREAAGYAAAAGAGRLVLTHLVPWYDPADVLADAARGDFAGPIELARAGATYQL